MSWSRARALRCCIVIQNEDYPFCEERKTVGQQFEQLTLKFANKYGSLHQALCREEGQL